MSDYIKENLSLSFTSPSVLSPFPKGERVHQGNGDTTMREIEDERREENQEKEGEEEKKAREDVRESERKVLDDDDDDDLDFDLDFEGKKEGSSISFLVQKSHTKK